MSAPALPLPEVAGSKADCALAAIRQNMADAARGGRWSVKPTPHEVDIAGVRVLHHHAQGASRGAVIHFHGGGFRMGMPEAVGPYARLLADLSGFDVYCPAYRLTPEAPFPAGLNDGWAVIGALAAQHGERLVLGGDSAGGGLAASLAIASRAAGVPVAGLILHSPWLDLTVTSASYTANALTDPLFSKTSAHNAATLYLQHGPSPDDPLASPLFADPQGYPATLISAGTGEVLAGDATAMHARLQAAGVDASLLMIEGMDHVAVTRGHELPGAAQTLEATASFLDRLSHL